MAKINRFSKTGSRVIAIPTGVVQDWASPAGEAAHRLSTCVRIKLSSEAFRGTP
jgi:hypothetical protein